MSTARPIVCLHTAESNLAVFDAAAKRLGIEAGRLRHRLREDLLRSAEAAGGVTPEILDEAARELESLRDGAGAVLLTCSTIGPAVERVAAGPSAPVLRVDAALAAAAVAGGGRVTVLCAVETTMGPTEALFRQAAAGTGAEIEMRLVPGAWARFRAGDPAGYAELVARAVESAAVEHPGGVVALAQASMAGAAAMCAPEARPMTSPEAGLAAAIKSADLNANF